MINGSRDFLKKNLDVQKCSVCVAKLIAAMKLKFSNKGLNKRVLEDSGDGAMANTRECSMKQLISNLLIEDSEL